MIPTGIILFCSSMLNFCKGPRDSQGPSLAAYLDTLAGAGMFAQWTQDHRRDEKVGIPRGPRDQHGGYEASYPLVMTNSLPWFFDGPNRNRCFSELKHGGFFHGELLNHSMVCLFFARLQDTIVLSYWILPKI